MTVAELIAKLQTMPQDAPIVAITSTGIYSPQWEGEEEYYMGFDTVKIIRARQALDENYDDIEGAPIRDAVLIA